MPMYFVNYFLLVSSLMNKLSKIFECVHILYLSMSYFHLFETYPLGLLQITHSDVQLDLIWWIQVNCCQKSILCALLKPYLNIFPWLLQWIPGGSRSLVVISLEFLFPVYWISVLFLSLLCTQASYSPLVAAVIGSLVYSLFACLFVSTNQLGFHIHWEESFLRSQSESFCLYF